MHPPKKTIDRFLRVETDRETFFALPVEMEGGLFVVMPLEKALGINEFRFTRASGGDLVAFGVPQIPVDGITTLIRFPVTEKNLDYWRMAECKEGSFIFDRDEEGNTTQNSSDVPEQSIGFFTVGGKLAGVVSSFPKFYPSRKEAEEVFLIGGADSPTAIWVTRGEGNWFIRLIDPLIKAMMPLIEKFMLWCEKRQAKRPVVEAWPFWIHFDNLVWQNIDPVILQEHGALLSKIMAGKRPNLPPDDWGHPAFEGIYKSFSGKR